MGTMVVSPSGAPALNTNRTLFSLIGANLNSTADQAFSKLFSFTRYRITEIVVANASTNLAAMVGTLAVRTATGGGGTAIVAAQNLTALTGADLMILCVIANGDYRNTATLYAVLSAGLGIAGACDIYINGYAIS